MVRTKEEKRLYAKEYRAKNKEKIRDNRAKNKENIREQSIEYRDKNKEHIREHNRVYKQTPAGKKSRTMTIWKSRGIIGDLSTIYDEIYLPSTNCEVCNNTYSSTFDRCLDHDHETGEFRQMLCRSCNTRDCWKKIIEIEI